MEEREKLLHLQPVSEKRLLRWLRDRKEKGPKIRGWRVVGRKDQERRKFVDIMERSKQVVQEINFKREHQFLE